MSPNQEPGTTARVFGHEFLWTAQHPRLQDIRKMLHTYDELASDALDRLDVLSPPSDKSPGGCPMQKRDLYALLERYSSSDQAIGRLWNQVTDIPDWVDWDQIRRGQKFVYQYYGQVQLCLLFTSLLGGMGAWRIVETLSRTGGFGVNVCRRRLLETLLHFVQVVESLDSIKPHGRGFASSVRVRLLHANVRRRIMRLEKQRPGYYDTEQWGVPINDLHQVGTVVAYSVSLVFLSLPRMGVFCTEQQIADYLALWRWVGYVMGTPVDWMSTPATAKAMMEAVLVSEIKPSSNSQIIANNILAAQTNSPPLYASRQFLAALAYRLNGEELATALNIARPNIWYRSLAGLQGAMLNLSSSNYALLPQAWQARRDKKLIQYSHNMVTNRKIGGLEGTTIFELQYMPEIGRMTEMGRVNISFWQRVTNYIVGLFMFFSGMIFLHT
ncbi:hypothetical protein LLEC1_05285 [Akanthomyces lecanii]|uniref:ER-bound oxygenase mpaB/mpaB'/Rubber oxygenase catalytic domain-containing protein n=1 Tax=Cordyceps confragosa TaxID=2714763 RepID=A0A179I381_CORDF|nr:hypothetical protein LLEC1_05285 [Akanthomyces lecanii]